MSVVANKLLKWDYIHTVGGDVRCHRVVVVVPLILCDRGVVGLYPHVSVLLLPIVFIRLHKFTNVVFICKVYLDYQHNVNIKNLNHRAYYL